MMKSVILFSLILLWCVACNAFEASEHIYAADKITLSFGKNAAPKAHSLLTLDNGIKLTYADITALAGDYYADSAQPISLGSSELDKKQRFMRAYATLGIDKHAVVEVVSILDKIHDEQKAIADGLKQGKILADVYASIELDHTIALNCITGGLCPSDYPKLTYQQFSKIYFLRRGRYLQLLDKNYDHFNNAALQTYQIGHALALEQAVQAYHTHDIKQLEFAYSLNAFASHFLGDLFAAGHQRTPRYALSSNIIPSSTGSILSGYMHNEDNKYGLLVTNAYGDSWRAYGDRYLLDARNQKNLQLLCKALQASVDGVFTAYLSGKMPADDRALQWVPNLTILANARDNVENGAPLFYVTDHEKFIWRRATITNRYDYHWIKDWDIWRTLNELTLANKQ